MVRSLLGSGYLLGAKDRDIVTIEHSNGWQYRQNFRFIDTIHHDDKSDTTSCSQSSKTPFRAYLAGAGIQFDLPLFKCL
jgi:hypothetical protein